MKQPTYSQELPFLLRLTKILSVVSTSTRSMDPERARREEWSFTKVYYPDRAVRLATSLLRLIPQESEPNPDLTSDLPSVACLARALLETYLLFFYFCSDPDADAAEMDLRRKIEFLHMKREESELSKALGEPEAHQQGRQDLVTGFRDTQVANHAAFDRVPPNMRKQVLSGREVTYIDKPELARKAGLEEGLYKAYYRVLSSLAHPHYFGAQHELRSGALGRDTERGRQQMTVILFLVNVVAAKLIDDMLSLLPELRDAVSDEDVAIIDQLKERFP